MKTRITLMVSLLISCPMVLHAEDLYLLPSTNEVLTAADPLIHQETYWTNGMIRWVPADQVLTQAETENGIVQATDTNAALLGTFTGNEIIDWVMAAASTNSAGRYGGGNKRTYQTIAIEPLESSASERVERWIAEYNFSEVHLQPAWYEWFNPGLFLTKWVEYWTTETNAWVNFGHTEPNTTPVVLVLVRF